MCASYTRSTAPAVAICTVGELFGGVERHVLELIGELQAEEIDPLLFLFHDAELAVQARQRSNEPVILRDRNLFILKTARQLATRLAQHRISVVHVHGYKAMVFCCLARVWY